MLSRRDPPQNKGHIQTESERLEKDISHKQRPKEKNLQPRLVYSARISFKMYGEIKSFTDKQKLREFSTTKPALQQMLKDLI